MNRFLQGIRRHFLEFEAWFEHKFGWFFTNGMKQDQQARTTPDGTAPVAPPKA